MRRCRLTGAILVIAKLDRLSRDIEFIARLQKSKVDFVCCDMPEANTLTIGMLAVMAQHERELISDRTKAGLQAAKARGKSWVILISTLSEIRTLQRQRQNASRMLLNVISKLGN